MIAWIKLLQVAPEQSRKSWAGEEGAAELMLAGYLEGELRLRLCKGSSVRARRLQDG